MEDKKTYQAIDCNLYDQLLLWSMKKTECNILLSEASTDESRTLKGIILDVFTKEKIEYLKLDNGAIVRLDHIIKINNMIFGKSCSF